MLVDVVCVWVEYIPMPHGSRVSAHRYGAMKECSLCGYPGIGCELRKKAPGWYEGIKEATQSITPDSCLRSEL